MKLNVTVDLEDFELGDFYNENGDVTLSDIIKKEITKKVIDTVEQQIIKKYKEDIIGYTRDEVLKRIEGIVESFKNSSEVFKYKVGYDTEEGTFKEMVKKVFEYKFQGSYNFDKTERFAKEFAEELRKRYDISFAALIVKNMKEQKLLADDKLTELIKQ